MKKNNKIKKKKNIKFIITLKWIMKKRKLIKIQYLIEHYI